MSIHSDCIAKLIAGNPRVRTTRFRAELHRAMWRDPSIQMMVNERITVRPDAFIILPAVGCVICWEVIDSNRYVPTHYHPLFWILDAADWHFSLIDVDARKEHWHRVDIFEKIYKAARAT